LGRCGPSARTGVGQLQYRPRSTVIESLIRINQLLFSAAWWQHGSWIGFATFISRKITKLIITRQPLKLEKNKHRFGIHCILEKFSANIFSKFKNNQILLDKTNHRLPMTTKLCTGFNILIYNSKCRSAECHYAKCHGAPK
jgi:hypothetical protein